MHNNQQAIVDSWNAGSATIQLQQPKTEYKVLVGEVGTIFEEKNIEFLVNKHLAEGWGLYGPMQVATPTVGAIKIYQAVMRTVFPYQQG